jgi:RNA polymerase sigma-B factor
MPSQLRARERVIVNHLPLARALALRYRGRGQPVDDLVQVASLALVKAADRWEPERGLAFSTFAVPTILGELRRYFRDLTWDVRPPRRLQELTGVVTRARGELAGALGREPTSRELAERLDRPVAEIEEALTATHARRGAPLDATKGGQDDEYARIDARVAFQQLTAPLDARAREALRLRFEDDLHQHEIAARLGISQVGVSRLLRTALEELRRMSSPPMAPETAPVM